MRKVLCVMIVNFVITLANETFITMMMVTE